MRVCARMICMYTRVERVESVEVESDQALARLRFALRFQASVEDEILLRVMIIMVNTIALIQIDFAMC